MCEGMTGGSGKEEQVYWRDLGIYGLMGKRVGRCKCEGGICEVRIKWGRERGGVVGAGIARVHGLTACSEDRKAINERVRNR